MRTAVEGEHTRTHDPGDGVRTVRDATYDVLRERGMTRVFANPGSTEVPFLAGWPDDLEFALALHEGSVVGMATGWAIARDEPALVLLHTTAGFGNAVGALATARVNRAPLVVVVGQQDRRHLAFEPFLTGRLDGLAGDYPVSLEQPARAQDVPGALGRAWHASRAARGPAVVIVPMDDWLEPAGEGEQAAAGRVVASAGAEPAAVDELAALVEGAQAPVLVAGAGADGPDGWDALVALAERLGCPVWQEPFGARAGFPQDHPSFAGHLPAERSRLRRALEPHDLVLVVGAPVLRQFPYAPGTLLPPGARAAVITDVPAEAHRSPADLAVVGPIPALCRALADRLPPGAATGAPPGGAAEPAPPDPPGPGEPLRAAHVLAALAERLPADAVVVEETPSSRPELHRRLRARAPLGFLSAAMGGLGFAIPAAIGVRMGAPGRPVVAVVGDGSSLYQVQALWSAARYGAGVLFVVLSNGGYAVMDRLAEHQGGDAPWPRIDDVDLTALAGALNCPARHAKTPEELATALDEIVPGLAERSEPLLLEVAVQPDARFEP